MVVFNVESQLISFRYSNFEFNLILDNNLNIEDMESELKYKAGLGSDVKFYDVGNWQIQKGQYVFEHPIIWLKRINERAETLDCQLVNVNLNAYIGDINVKTTITCINGWNKRGLGNHVEKVLGLKKGVFRIYTNGDNESLRSTGIMVILIR
jgi:hypothetical protein